MAAPRVGCRNVARKNRVPEPTAYLNAIGTAVPAHDAHHAFLDWAVPKIADPRLAKLFGRMVARSGIEHRWTVLPEAPGGGSPIQPGGGYGGGVVRGRGA